MQQALDRVGQGLRACLVGDQSGLAVSYELGNAGDGGGNTWRAQSHRFQQYGGKAVAIAITGHQTRSGEHRSPAKTLLDHAARLRSDQLHTISDTQRRSSLHQIIPEHAIADDLASELATSVVENRACFDQIAKSLLLHQAAHADDQRILSISRTIRKLLQVQSVIHPSQPCSILTEPAAEVLEVVITHRHGGGGVTELPPQALLVYAFVIDIFGVSGKRIGNARQASCESCHGGRDRGEVRVEVSDAASECRLPKQDRLIDVAGTFRLGDFQDLLSLRQLGARPS